MPEAWARFTARDTRLDHTVAIKVLPERLSADPQLRERFKREAEAISSLSHPHICPLYDVGHQDGIDFLVMEYFEGETLAHWLKIHKLLNILGWGSVYRQVFAPMPTSALRPA